MFSWRKPAAASFDVDGLEKVFDALVAQVNNLSQERQMGVAAGVTFACRSFGTLYPNGVNEFIKQRPKIQADFINVLTASANDASKNPAAINISGQNLGNEMAMGIKLANMYFTALLPLSHNQWRTDEVFDMVDRLSGQITPLNEKGRAFFPS